MPDLIVSKSKGRADPADLKLVELSNKGNYKQALADIEKRLKKGSSDRLLVNKAILLYSTQDTKQRNNAILLLTELANSETAFRDKDILFALDDLVNGCQMPLLLCQKLRALWDKALKDAPLEEGFALEAFESRFLASDYELAQKCAQSQLKRGRAWRMRWIVATHLLAQSPTSKNPNKTMLATLALRSLERDAQNALKNEATAKKLVDANPGLAYVDASIMHGRREFSLLLQILESNGEYDRAVALLDEVCKHLTDEELTTAYEYVVKKRLEMLEGSKRWQRLWEGCLDWVRLLEKAKEGNRSETEDDRIAVRLSDFSFWKMLSTSAFYTGSEDIAAEFQHLVGSNLSTNYRNARLAQILFLDLRYRDRNESPMELAELCVDYFRTMADKPMCFRDLKIANLRGHAKVWFLEKAREHSYALHQTMQPTKASRRRWLCSEINTMKQEYHRTISNSHNSTNLEMMEIFAKLCLRLYDVALGFDLDLERVDMGHPESSTGERHPGDDAAILAAMTLILMGLRRPGGYLLRSTFILERVLARSPHNYDAALIAVRAHMCMGLPERAIDIFRKLDIKNLQHLSTSWILTTRISGLNPHSDRIADFVDQSVKAILKVSSASSKMTRRYLELSCWDNLLLHVSTFEAAEYSISSCIANAEQATCTLFRGKGSWSRKRLDIPIDSANDFREDLAFPTYEADPRWSIEESLRYGPKPEKPWAVMKLQAQDLRLRLAARTDYVEVARQEDLWPSEHSPGDKPTDMAEAEFGFAEQLGMIHRVMNGVMRLSHHDGDILQIIGHLTGCLELILNLSLAFTQEVIPAMNLPLEDLRKGIEGRFHWLSGWVFQHASIVFESLKLTSCLLSFIDAKGALSGVYVGYKPSWLIDRKQRFFADQKNVLIALRAKACLFIETLQYSKTIDYLVHTITANKSEYDQEIVDRLVDSQPTAASLTIRRHCLHVAAGWRSCFEGMIKSIDDMCKLLESSQ